MQLAADVTDQLSQASLDRSVDVLVVGAEFELAGLQLACDAVEALAERGGLGVVDHAGPA